MKPLIPYCLVFLAVFLYGSAEPILPLPEQDDIPGWVKEGPPRQFVPDTLFNHINGGAEIFNEFGFQELHVQSYRNGSQEITVELYRMDDSPAALGMFYQQGGQSEGQPEDEVHLMKSPYQWTLQKGSWFVQLNAPAEARGLEDGLSAFADAIASMISPKPCHIFDLLPVASRVPHSEFLVRGPYAMQPVFTLGDGDILHLGGRHYGIGALYLDGTGSRYTRLMVRYTDDNEARIVFQNLTTHLDPYLHILSKDNEQLVFRDFKEEYGCLHLTGNLLEITLNLARDPR